WPLAVIVDHVLEEKPMPAALARGIALLPGSGTRENLLAWAVVATVVLFLLGWALSLANSYVNIGFGQRLVYDLAADVFAHLQRLSLRFHTRKSVGDSIRRVTADCRCVSTIVEDALAPVLASVFGLVTMFFIMWRLDATLTLVALAVVPFMVVALRHYAG